MGRGGILRHSTCPQVVFSDEKIFRARPGGVTRVWRRRGDRYKAGYTTATTARTFGVTVWCAIDSSGRCITRRCPDRLNSTGYQAVLATAKAFIAPRRVGICFQQDGAPCHKSISTTAWLRTNHVNLLNGGEWPAMSPDCNIVEHIWPLVLRNMGYQTYNTQDELWAALQNAFLMVTPAEVQTLYGSMSRRMAAVIVARGGHTKY